MPRFSLGSHKDRYSDDDIIEIFKSSDEEKKKEVSAYCSKRYTTMLFLNSREYRMLSYHREILEAVLVSFERWINQETFSLKTTENLNRLFKHIFDQELLNKRDSFVKKDHAFLKAYLSLRFQKELSINRETARIPASNETIRSIFDESQERFFRKVNKAGFKVRKINSLKDEFEKEWDKSLVEALQSPGTPSKHRNKLMQYLYERFFRMPMVLNQKAKVEAIIKKTGSDSGEYSFTDLFVDAITAFTQNIINSNFERRSKLSVYFISILKYKIIDLYRKLPTNKDKEEEIEKIKEGTPIPIDPVKIDQIGNEEDLSKQIEIERVNEATNKLSKKCQEILKLHYYKELKLNKISEILGISRYLVEKRLKECQANFIVIYQRLLL